jgi:FHS family Na+ dependent glucose MFS transporter 1
MIRHMKSATTKPKSFQPLLFTAAYYLSFIILGLSTAVEGPSLPTLARHTSSSLDQISLMFVVGSLGYLLGSIIGGKTYDSLPGHRFLAGTMAVMVAAAIVFPLASSLWVLLLTALVMGLCKGAVDVGGNTLLQWVHKEKVGPFMNGMHFSFGLGSFFSPILLAQIFSATQEIYWSFWIIALLIIPLAVWFWFLPEPPAQSNTGQIDHSPTPFVPVFLIVVAFILYVGAEVGFADWIYTYAVTLNLATAVSAAYLTSAFWGSFTAARLLGVWISTRVSSRTIIFVDLAGCLASLVLIILGKESAPLLWAGSIGLGFSMASIFPTILMLAGESLRVTGTITGWFLVGSGAGGMLLPWLIGQAITASGAYAMMTIILADLILTGLILAAFIYGVRPSVAVTSEA